MTKNSSPSPIHVIGTDASGLRNLPLYLKTLVLSSKSIAAPRRLLEELPQWWGNESTNDQIPEFVTTDKPNELIKWLKEKKDLAIVFASGDPLWFGIGRVLLEALPSQRLKFHPSPSSLQLAFARLGRPWQNASWISLHGRDPSPLEKLLKNRPNALAILTDPGRGGAEEVRKILLTSGLAKTYTFWICERLGHPQEKIQEIFTNSGPIENIHPLHIVILIAKTPSGLNPESIPLFGIEDDLFLHHQDRPGLMTKREARVQILADLELPKKGILWDLGAGIGTIGLEALRLRPDLQLLAVEKRVGASALIQKNANRLGLKPIKIIEADALELIKSSELPHSLEKPDRVILGGGGDLRGPLLKLILQKLRPGGIVVIPLATIEAISELRSIFESTNCPFRLSQHQTWRAIPLSNGTRLSPNNPIFIMKGTVPS